jgi:hypothetical protein
MLDTPEPASPAATTPNGSPSSCPDQASSRLRAARDFLRQRLRSDEAAGTFCTTFVKITSTLGNRRGDRLDWI